MLALAKRQVDGAGAGEENDPGSRVLVLHPLGICYKGISSGAGGYFEQASRGIPEGKDGSGEDGTLSLGIKALKIPEEIVKIRLIGPKASRGTRSVFRIPEA